MGEGMVGRPQSWEVAWRCWEVGCRGGAATKDGTSSGAECTEGGRGGGGKRREEDDIRLAKRKGHSRRRQAWGRSGGERATFGRSVLGLYPSFFDKRRPASPPDQRASVADTHGRYGGRKPGWLHVGIAP